MYILSADFGTSSLKMAILDENTKIIETTKVEYQYHAFNQDWVEMDVNEVFAAMVTGINNLSKYKKNIDAIAYDTFSPSMVFMDKDGEALYPLITHLDRRSKKQTTRILNEMGKEAFQSITGIQPFTGGASITTVLWMMENMPDLFKNTHKFGHLNTYIYHKLTGCWATDPTNASMMGMYETTKCGTWSKDIYKTFGIPKNKLPDIYNAGTIIGVLNKEMAQLTGLQEGIPVVLGSNDVATSQIGAGNVNEGDILNISGSSEMISIISDKPIVSNKYYLRNAITPGKWQIYATTLGGFAIDWFRREFYRDQDINYFFDVEFPNVIRNNINKTNVEFLPYLVGDRQSLTPKKASFTGITIDTKREDLLAAILLGIHEPILKTIELTNKFMKHNKTIKLTGAMNNSSFINVKKELFKKFEFDFVVKEDCPIIGNAILALQALKSQR